MLILKHLKMYVMAGGVNLISVQDGLTTLMNCTRAPDNIVLVWRDTGKPRRGKIFDMMQQSRARFKYAIRAVKHRENALRRESLRN